MAGWRQAVKSVYKDYCGFIYSRATLMDVDTDVDTAGRDQALLVQRLDVVVGELQADDADHAADDQLQGKKADDEDQAGFDGEVLEHAGIGKLRRRYALIG